MASSRFSEANKALVVAMVTEVLPDVKPEDVVAHKHRCDTFLDYRWCLMQRDSTGKLTNVLALGTTTGMVRSYINGVLLTGRWG